MRKPGEPRQQSVSNNSLSPLAKGIQHLKEWQKTVMTARQVALNYIDGIAHELSEPDNRNRAIDIFLEQASLRALPEPIQRALEVANHRNNGDRLVSKGTVYRWFALRAEFGLIGLAPLDTEKPKEPPVWLAEFLSYYRLPGKPSVKQAIEAMALYRTQNGLPLTDIPHYMTVNRTLKKVSAIDLQRGRMSGSELRSIKGYTIRDKSHLEPMDVAVMDGHSFKGKIQNPFTGNPFTPEIEAVIDAATCVLLGWSCGLAESSMVVADAIRHSVTADDGKGWGGIAAIYYADCGAGNKSRYISDEVTGVMARLGSSLTFSIPGNAQARGVIERAIGSIWVRSARELQLYHGNGADSLTLRRNLKIVEADIKRRGSSPLILSWQQFIDWLKDTADAYNNRPHTRLPKITDPSTGWRRHMTPFEMWQEFIRRGWSPYTMSTEEAREMFMPQVIVTVKRAMVKVLGQTYYNKELEHWHEQRVIAQYDIQDGRQVWVRDLKGRLICVALFEANKRAMFPESYVEQARHQRKMNRLRTAQRRTEEILAEAVNETIEAEVNNKAELLDYMPSQYENVRPIFTSETEKEEWENEQRRISNE